MHSIYHAYNRKKINFPNIRSKDKKIKSSLREIMSTADLKTLMDRVMNVLKDSEKQKISDFFFLLISNSLFGYSFDLFNPKNFTSKEDGLKYFLNYVVNFKKNNS